MSEFVFKLPDLGEGTVEAEIVQWHVEIGDRVKENDPIVDLMTDKANVEVPSPVTGLILRRHGEPGDKIPVGTELMALDIGGSLEPQSASNNAAATVKTSLASNPSSAQVTRATKTLSDSGKANSTAEKTPSQSKTNVHTDTRDLPEKEQQIITSPAIRRQAKERGIDLTKISGSGPRGRILRADLDQAPPLQAVADNQKDRTSDETQGVEAIKIIGIRRLIAQRLTRSALTIPHFSYVEEVDITALEALREDLNKDHAEQSLTYLPFIGYAVIRAIAQHPQINARYDSDTEMLYRYSSVNLGIATQTPDGLKVPVIHQADRLNLWQLAAAIQQKANQARDGTASTEDLQGSSITVTSLGKLGGIASTPVINAPEVAIVGVNKAQLQPRIHEGAVAVRRVMNLSSSFDHRIVDGHDAASFIQSVKYYLEQPARLFIPER